MDETIDYSAVIHQLQLENEMLRNSMKTFTEVRETIYKVPNFVETMYHKVMANKYSLLIGVMVVYWVVSIGLMFYDRLKGGA